MLRETARDTHAVRHHSAARFLELATRRFDVDPDLLAPPLASATIVQFDSDAFVDVSRTGIFPNRSAPFTPWSCAAPIVTSAGATSVSFYAVSSTCCRIFNASAAAQFGTCPELSFWSQRVGPRGGMFGVSYSWTSLSNFTQAASFAQREFGLQSGGSPRFVSWVEDPDALQKASEDKYKLVRTVGGWLTPIGVPVTWFAMVVAGFAGVSLQSLNLSC